jgi:hypothetical protein
MISLQVWDPTETKRYPSIEAEIEELTFGSMIGIGFGPCSFAVKRDPRRYHDDLKPTNRIIVRDGRKVRWAGDIIAPVSDVQDQISMPIEADGLGYRLATREVVAPFTSGKGSTWITNNLIADTDLDYDVGLIDTSDFNFPYGIDLSPCTYFAEALDKINKANGYYYGMRADGFHYEPYPTTAAYEVRAQDAKYQLDYSIEEIENCLFVSYTTDGSLYKYFWYPNTDMVNFTGTAVPDQTSKDLYKRRDGVLAVQGKSTLAQAAAMAAVALAERKRMRPKSSFVVTRVTSAATGVEVPLTSVEDGKLIHFKDLYTRRMSSTEARIINELSTFEIAETSCTVRSGGNVDELTVSPGTMGMMMEKMLARIEARTVA